jgi:hypothetical protein
VYAYRGVAKVKSFVKELLIKSFAKLNDNHQ